MVRVGCRRHPAGPPPQADRCRGREHAGRAASAADFRRCAPRDRKQSHGTANSTAEPLKTLCCLQFQVEAEMGIEPIIRKTPLKINDLRNFAPQVTQASRMKLPVLLPVGEHDKPNLTSGSGPFLPASPNRKSQGNLVRYRLTASPPPQNALAGWPGFCWIAPEIQRHAARRAFSPFALPCPKPLPNKSPPSSPAGKTPARRSGPTTRCSKSPASMAGCLKPPPPCRCPLPRWPCWPMPPPPIGAAWNRPSSARC
jgi:hypothetical protein